VIRPDLVVLQFYRASPVGRRCGGLTCWVVLAPLEMVAGRVCRCREECVSRD